MRFLGNGDTIEKTFSSEYQYERRVAITCKCLRHNAYVRDKVIGNISFKCHGQVLKVDLNANTIFNPAAKLSADRRVSHTFKNSINKRYGDTNSFKNQRKANLVDNVRNLNLELEIYNDINNLHFMQIRVKDL